MINKIYLLILGILLVGVVSAANFWVDDPTTCPLTYLSQGPFSGTVVCGETGGTVFFYDPASLTAYGTNTTTNSNTVSTENGGYWLDCYSYDGSVPYCDSGGDYTCDRNNTCYNKGVNSVCLEDTFGQAPCSTCRTNYFECDGSHTDADGCEVLGGGSCDSGRGTFAPGECQSGVGNCTQVSNFYDCDDSDGDANNETCNTGSPACEINVGSTPNTTNAHWSSCITTTCNTNYYGCDGSILDGDGCEVNDGGACSVGSLSGTWSCVAGSGGCYNTDDQSDTQQTCTCVVATSHFITGVLAEYQTNSSQAMFWGIDYNVGTLFNLSWSAGGGFYINSTGAYFNGTKLGTSSLTYKGWYNSTLINTTQMEEQTGGILGIKVSWLTTFVNNLINSIFSQSNEWTEVQNFTGGINLKNNATVSGNGTGTSFFIDQHGNFDLTLK